MATRFRFRLEPLRRLREALEREAERALGRALQVERDIREEIDRLAAQRQAVFEARRSGTGQRLDLEAWRWGEAYLVVLERRQDQAFERLREASKQGAAARDALTEAHRNHLMLVRLKERRALLHAQEEARLEAIALDELAVLRHARRTA
jgi:flagellar export protein FliJ